MDICYTTKQVLIILKRLKYQVSFLTTWYETSKLIIRKLRIHKYMKIKQHVIEQQVGQIFKKRIKNTYRQMKMEIQHSKTYRMTKSSSMRETHRTCLHQEARNLK